MARITLRGSSTPGAMSNGIESAGFALIGDSPTNTTIGRRARTAAGSAVITWVTPGPHVTEATASLPVATLRCREWLEIEGGVISSLMQQAIPAEAGEDYAMTSHGTIPGQPHLETETAVPLFAQALRPYCIASGAQARFAALVSRPCNPVNYRAGTGARCKQQERNRLPVKGKI
jgi:hypothetical protein